MASCKKQDLTPVRSWDGRARHRTPTVRVGPPNQTFPLAGPLRWEPDGGRRAFFRDIRHGLRTLRRVPGLSRPPTLNGEAHEVIGILPAGTPFLDGADVFRPLVRTTNAQRGSWELFGVGRVKPGVTLEAARTDVQRVAAVLAERHPETNKGMSANVAPLNELVAGDGTRRALWVLLGAVGFLLLIACVNLTNLLLAKAAGLYSRDRDPCRAWREPPAHRRFAGGRIASLVVGGGSIGSAAVGVDARSVARQQCLGDRAAG